MSLSLIPLRGLPLVEKGDNLAELLIESLSTCNVQLQDFDIVVVAQKIVSKAEGRQVRLDSIEPSDEAIRLAKETEKDPRLVELILQESTEVVRTKPGVLITRHRLGHVGAHSGIDQSNIDHGSGDSCLLLPVDPDASARRLQETLSKTTGNNIGVIISDSANRPWRLGTVGIAIGTANVCVLDDRRGGQDLFERELKVTLVNVADSIATAATLVMGETTERIPAVVVRGVATPPGTDDASAINRPIEEDLFR
ncbi:MAG: coenzyme F420-0:L-glutamate ligase [Gammaproteobacteria bacterium]|nr:coenzyme F420-0:L-glutamate ligase [Gammaproteobacteria bacterium]